MAFLGVMAPLASHAAIQRTIINGGFEQPVLTPGSQCYVIIGSDAVPGWESTHSVPTAASPNMYCGPNIGYSTPGAFGGGQMEIWATGHDGGAPATGLGNYWTMTGKQHAELNPWGPARYYQNVCLINGETVGYAVGHRGRRSKDDRDVAEFNIDSASNTVMRTSTSAWGYGGVVQCGGSATGETNGPFGGSADNSVGSPVCSSKAVNDGWRNYTGTFQWNGTTGTHNIGLESISVAGGDLRTGNLVDEVSVTLRPLIEFTGTTSFAGTEGGSVAQPQIVVLGTVPAGGIAVSLRATGTNTAGSSDYTLGSFTVPAGVYDTVQVFTLTGAMAIVDDAAVEDNESVALELAPSSSYLISSTQTCGGAANNRITLSITDNDVDVRTTKSAASASVPRGGTAAFTVTYQNNTARPTTGDTTAHDVSVSIADAIPAGIGAYSWTCTASAGATCPAASGTGAISATASLPAGTGGAAGGTLTYAINGTLTAQQCASVTNTSTIALASGSTKREGTSAQTGFTTPAPGGTANNTASASVTPDCAPQLTIVKSATPGSFAVGQPATYSLAVSNTGSASTSGAIRVTDPLPTGVTATLPITVQGWDCTASTTTLVDCSSSTVLPAGSNAPVINATVSVAAGTANPAVNTATVQGGGDTTCPAATAHCTSTTTTPVNAPRLDVSKRLTGNFVVGVPAVYTIQVTNGGTSNTLAGTLTDTIPTGLDIGTVSSGCVLAGRVVTCTIPAGMTPGQSISFTVDVTPQASASGLTLTNSAVANGGGDVTCPTAPHCTGTTSDTVSAPQLSLTKTASPNPFVIDVAATYTLTLTNIGTAATTATTTLSDTIPDGLTLGTLPAGCTAAGRVVTCTVAAPLATNTPQAFVIPVTPQASLRGLSVTNTATATGGGDPSCTTTTNPLPSRCIGTTTTPVNAPKLDIVKTASSASFVVGTAASYTLKVTSSGTAATTAAATVTDVVPAGLVINSAPGCTVSGQTVTCTINAPFNVGATTSFTVNVTPAASANGQTLANTATVSGGGDPTCPADTTHCASTVSTPVNGPQLTIVKTASDPGFSVGVPASYTIKVTNSGAAATTAAATVSDNVPSTLTLGAMPTGCSNSGQVVTCTVATGLAVGANVSFVIPVTPTQAAGGTTVVNTATVSGGGDPSCPAASHCTSTVSVPVARPEPPATKLSILKTASNAVMTAGVSGDSFTFVVTNQGPSATSAVATVTDVLPIGFDIDGTTAGCTVAGQTVTCTIPAGFAVNAQVSFTVAVTPNAEQMGEVVNNTATVQGGGDTECPNATRCSSTVAVEIDFPPS